VIPDPNTPGTDAGSAPRLAGLVARRTASGVAAAAARLRARTARAWARRPSPARGVAFLFLAGAAALGARGILFQAGLSARLPSRLDWAAVRALLERDARPGDAVALAPAWVERAREVVPAAVPLVARTGRGEDLPGVRRVWLLSVARAPGYDWQTELAVVSRSARSTPAQRLGAIEVTRHDLAYPTLPLAFLPDRLPHAEVTLGGAACAASGGGFTCGGSTPVRVERAVREVAGVPRPCLTASMTAPAGAPLALAFPGVPVGRVVRGHAGAAGRGRTLAAPVRIAVQIDGEEAGAAELSGPGFAPFEIDTRHLGGRLHAVTLVLTSPGAPGTLCLDAATLP
jgi:hypothetical protein